MANSKPFTAAQARSAMLSHLSKSGLGEKHTKALGIYSLTAAEAEKRFSNLTSEYRAGFVIPYFDMSGKAIKDFFRFRYVEDAPRNGWEAIAGQKPLRYVQPKDTAPRLYVPPVFDWPSWRQESSRTLFITEGEKKAAAGCVFGFPTVALGGVWNFKSTRRSQALIPDLAEMPWEGRRVYIVYDSDAASNVQVICAENELARQLVNLSAFVHIVRLPALEPGVKTGLDDYLVSEGAEAFASLVQEEAPEWEASRELRRMNEEVVFIRRSTEVMTLADRQLYPTRKYFDLYADRNYVVKTAIAMPNGGSAERLAEKNAAKEWFKWPGRTKAQRLVYEPGNEGLIYRPGEEYPDYNVWFGWGVEPKSGNVQPFLDLVDFLLAECTEDQRAWFMRWLAYPIQHPGTKLYSCVLVHGRHQGTGKSMLGEIVGRIYGDNYRLVNDSELLAPFNEWARHRQFIMGDEIGAKVRKAADLMKGYITQEHVTINLKFVSQYTVRDCINYLFTSNHPDATYLEETDRRHFVVQVHARPREDAFYAALREFKNSDGPARLMDYLLKLPLGDFNPSAHPPVTSAKSRMIDASRSEASLWAVTLRDNPERLFNPHGAANVNGKKRTVTPEQLRASFAADGKSLGSTKTMKAVLSETGFVQASEGAPIWINKRWGNRRVWLLDASLEGASDETIRKVFIAEHGEKPAQGAKF